MPFINYASREINLKIVYYGAGLCGKTTNVQYLHRTLGPKHRGRLISLQTETERTLFFDFLPVSLGQVRGFSTRFHLYTVPGQIFYAASRGLILKGADAVVFVVDSQLTRMEANGELLANLREQLGELNRAFDSVPLVFQYNKRDHPDAAPVPEMSAIFNPSRRPEVEAVATLGTGVYQTLREAAKGALRSLGRTELVTASAGE
ncbi:MAG: GTPase domain-containing protein [Deltaproteobacteria bacterium]|nr:GTPase domain-containing protein [Deltaproteobacteria bacterium]